MRRLVITATRSMPANTPPCCAPESLVEAPGVKAKMAPANGSKMRSCALYASIETNTNSVKRRASGSDQTWRSAVMNAGLASGASLFSCAFARPSPSTPQMATSATARATPDTPPATASRRAGENGSRSLPATVAVIAKPAIIIIHTIVAAAARRSPATRLAMRTRREVPHALTPQPIAANDAIARAMPSAKWAAMSVVAKAAPTPPAASTAIPPTIHGVRRWPRSAPCPMRGRSICIA